MNLKTVLELLITAIITLQTSFATFADSQAPELPTKSKIIATAKKVNDYWIANHLDPGNNEWARATYFAGNIELYKVSQKKKYLDYTLKWANNNQWAISGGTGSSNADNHAAGQVYLDLYLMDSVKVASRISAIESSIDYWIENFPLSDKWWWADALFMAMPTITRLGAATGKEKYYEKLYALFRNTRDTLIVNSSNTYLWTQEYRTLYGEGPIVTCPVCGNDSDGLYNKADRLWYRDWRYQPGVPPGYDWYASGKNVAKQSPNGKNIYWSRGNGWVFAALARTLQFLPETDAHRTEYIEIFTEMAEALKNCQRADGFWNMNLGDPEHYPAPETSGTGFFTFGLAWGINNALLDSATYYPVVSKAWNGLSTIAVEPDGNVKYAQNVGESPIDPSRLTTSSVDFGVGAVLFAASEVAKLAFDDGLPDDGDDETDDNEVLLDRSDWEIVCSSEGAVDAAVAPIGDYPKYIVDGDNVTAFLFVKPGVTYGGVTVPANTKPWFMINLKKVCDMTYMLYRHRDHGNTTTYLRASKGSFYGSNTGEDNDWQPIIENFDITTDDAEVRINFPEKVSYQYVKFIIEEWLAPPRGNTIQISEFNLGNTAATGIKTVNTYADSQVSVYPNPVKAGQAFTVRLNGELADAVISIYSSMGVKLDEKRVNSNFAEQIVNHRGIYIVTVKKNVETYTFKIIVN
jgi:rhamnogalacturonyl hydrolase YesR